jgi:ribosomal protein S16
MDMYESQYITEYNSKYPDGYNLTNGGQTHGCKKGDKIVFHEPNVPHPLREKQSLNRSDYTKRLISERMKVACQDTTHREMQMKHTQKQHYQKKFDRFAQVTIDQNNPDQYLYVRSTPSSDGGRKQYVRIKIDGKFVDFVGKYEPIFEIKQRALQFIIDLIQWQHNQIAGTSLETSPTTSLLETTDEGTRVMTETNGKNGKVLDNPQPSP